jgi:hypothetical protein
MSTSQSSNSYWVKMVRGSAATVLAAFVIWNSATAQSSGTTGQSANNGPNFVLCGSSVGISLPPQSESVCTLGQVLSIHTTEAAAKGAAEAANRAGTCANNPCTGAKDAAITKAKNTCYDTAGDEFVCKAAEKGSDGVARGCVVGCSQDKYGECTVTLGPVVAEAKVISQSVEIFAVFCSCCATASAEPSPDFKVKCSACSHWRSIEEIAKELQRPRLPADLKKTYEWVKMIWDVISGIRDFLPLPG